MSEIINPLTNQPITVDVNTEPVKLVYTNSQDAGIDVSKFPIDKIEEPIIIKGYEPQTPPDLSIEVPMVTVVEPTPEQSIYEKYADIVNGYQDGVVRGMTYPISMEILRYCEKVIGNQIPINMGCTTCVFDLVKLFVNLKNK